MKRLFGTFLLLLFWQALDVRFDASVMGGCEALCLEIPLEQDESSDLDNDDPSTWEAAADDIPNEDTIFSSFEFACVFGANPYHYLANFLKAHSARWSSCAADAGSSIPLFLLYHYLKGY